MAKENQKEKTMIITGSYLNTMAGDIPAQNWGPKEWTAQFDVFVEMKMDTLVMCSSGCGQRALYPSKHIDALMVEDDLIEFFLRMSDERGLKMYLSTYSSGYHWLRNDWQAEVDAALPVIDEVFHRYRQHPSFHGWSLCHEGDERFHMPKIWGPLARHIKSLDASKPILAPFRYSAEKYHGVCVGSGQHPLNPEQHGRCIEYLFGEMEGLITHAAFMDGHCHYKDLKAFVEVTAELCRRYHVDFWANVETFDRDMPWRFPPIEWTKLKFKIKTQAPYVSKMIMFEAPHFLSPYSMFPSARSLYDRYMEHALGVERPARLN